VSAAAINPDIDLIRLDLADAGDGRAQVILQRADLIGRNNLMPLASKRLGMALDR